MVVVFAVFGAGLGVEQVVACDEFEDLYMLDMAFKRRVNIRTMHAILHTSVLAPHFAPRITSGDRY